MRDRDQIRQAFADLVRARCNELNVNVICPYSLQDKDGETAEFIAFLPDHGSGRGMLIDILGSAFETRQRDFAKAHSLYLSLVNPESWQSKTGAREALKDWGFFAERRKRADFELFDRIMARSGGTPPEGDDIL